MVEDKTEPETSLIAQTCGHCGQNPFAYGLYTGTTTSQSIQESLCTTSNSMGIQTNYMKNKCRTKIGRNKLRSARALAILKTLRNKIEHLFNFSLKKPFDQELYTNKMIQIGFSEKSFIQLKVSTLNIITYIS